VQYQQIRDKQASIINDIGRCASCHQPGRADDEQVSDVDRSNSPATSFWNSGLSSPRGALMSISSTTAFLTEACEPQSGDQPFVSRADDG